MDKIMEQKQNDIHY